VNKSVEYYKRSLTASASSHPITVISEIPLGNLSDDGDLFWWLRAVTRLSIGLLQIDLQILPVSKLYDTHAVLTKLSF
jgi:hypothetical protein